MEPIAPSLPDRRELGDLDLRRDEENAVRAKERKRSRVALLQDVSKLFGDEVRGFHKFSKNRSESEVRF
jgi:hypothetical protein